MPLDRRVRDRSVGSIRRRTLGKSLERCHRNARVVTSELEGRGFSVKLPFRLDDRSVYRWSKRVVGVRASRQRSRDPVTIVARSVLRSFEIDIDSSLRNSKVRERESFLARRARSRPFGNRVRAEKKLTEYPSDDRAPDRL